MMKKAVLAVGGVAAALCAMAAEKHMLPPGAASAGYMKCVLNERPKAEDVGMFSAKAKVRPKWYSGRWDLEACPPLSKYSTTNGVLCIESGGEIVSAPLSFRGNPALPYIPGEDGFYVEVEYSLSTNEKGKAPVVAVLPKEKNQYLECTYPGDPEDYERWMELYVDEGRHGEGMSGTVWNWWGVKALEGYHFERNGNFIQHRKIDRTGRHVFGASFNPRKGAVYWWLDNRFSHGASWASVPDIAARQNFYLSIRAEKSASGKPYKMFVHAVRVFVPATSPLKAVEYVPDWKLAESAKK